MPYHTLVKHREIVDSLFESCQSNIVTILTGLMGSGKSLYAYSMVELYEDSIKKVVIGTPLREHRDDVFRRIGRKDRLLLQSKVEVCLRHVCRGDILYDTAMCAECKLKRKCDFFTILNTVRSDSTKSFCVITTHDCVSVVYPHAQLVIMDDFDVQLHRIRLYSKQYVEDFLSKLSYKQREAVSRVLREAFIESKLAVRKETSEYVIEEYYVSKPLDISNRTAYRPHLLISATIPTISTSTSREEIEKLLEREYDDVMFDIIANFLFGLCSGILHLYLQAGEDLKLNIIKLKSLFRSDRIFVYRHRIYMGETWAVNTAIKYTVEIANRALAMGKSVGILLPNKRIKARVMKDIKPSSKCKMIVVGDRESRGLNIDKDVIIAWYQHPYPKTEIYDGVNRIVMQLGTYLLLPYRLYYGEKIMEVIEDWLFKTIVYAENVQSLFRFIRRWWKEHIVILLDYRLYDALRWFKPTHEYLLFNKVNVYSSIVELFEDVKNFI